MDLFHTRDNAGSILTLLRLVACEQLPQVTAAFRQQFFSYLVDFIYDRVVHVLSSLFRQQLFRRYDNRCHSMDLAVDRV
jgi:hypothetical protein